MPSRFCRKPRAPRCEAERAPDSQKTAVIKQIPIFPLSVVAFPTATVPLMIFEPRYRVLFNTLLDGEPGIEEGLVQKESPFCGTKRFGMCFLDSGRMASVGTTLEVQEYLHQPDGRIYITNKGIERFRVVRVVKELPVLICEVEVLEEVEEDKEAAKESQELADEVVDMFRNTLRLHSKVTKKAGSISEETLEPPELSDLSPRELSYWIANAFQESRYTQQELLEELNTTARLAKEREVLSATLKFYSAATALESVFKGSEGEQLQPPPGGPD